MIWGFFSLPLKPLVAYQSLDILFYRVFFCAALLLVVSLFFRRGALKNAMAYYRELAPAGKRSLLWITAGGGALLTANWFFFIYVMNHISIKAASFAYLVCPILTTVLAWIILKERLSRWQWLAVALSAVSCILLSFHHVIDILYSLIVAISYALYLVTQRGHRSVDKLLLLTLQMLCSALLLLPFYFSYGSIPAGGGNFYWLVLVIAVLFTIVPLYLNLYALQGLSSSTIGILLYINPLINFLIAILYYKEPITTLQVIAYGVIFLSILVFNIKYLAGKRSARIAKAAQNAANVAA